MIDFIIVGRGLAANILAHTFHKNGITFRIIGSPDLSRSSIVAAGIWNPVVFKRLTPSWLANQTVPFLKKFYVDCEKSTGKKFMYETPIAKPFVQEQEKELWLKKSKNELDDYLSPVFNAEESKFSQCNFNGQYGLVKQSGYINTAVFLEATSEYFKDFFIEEVFDYSLLKHEPGNVSYKGISALNIIFCEGHLVKNNPFFHWVPLKPAKGEILTIQSEELELNNCILNKGAFIMKTAPGIYKSGATYEWEDLTEEPTTKGRQELEAKLSHLITAKYSIVKHEAGVRPSSLDRRPVIGKHPNHSNLFVFNGLGTKGIMLAPWFANNFVLSYLQKHPLNAEADVKRFYKLFTGGN